MQNEAIKGGISCYLMTPFDANGGVEKHVLADYVDAMIECGVDGLTCIASTCEGPYLTESERRLVVSTVGKVARGRVKLNIGIAAVSTRQTIEYAKQAADAGATSLMLEMQQYFPITFDDAIRHYEAVARAVSLEIRLYNITGTTRFDFTPPLVARMGQIESIKSVKEASGDVTRIRDINALAGHRFVLFAGFHFQVLDAIRFGAIGWEAALHPVIAKPCIDLFRAATADPNSEQAQNLYNRLESLFYFFKYYGVPQSVKAISADTDLSLGKPRAPLAELAPDQIIRLRQIVRDLSELTDISPRQPNQLRVGSMARSA